MLKPGDKIIWDSNFGYDLGIFEKEEGVMYGTCQVNLTTGIVQGSVSFPIHEVHKYTKKLHNQMKIKYREV